MARLSAWREQLTEEGGEARKSLIKKERKVLGQERILTRHLDRLEKSDFCDAEKPHQRAYQKGKMESN